MGTGERTTRWGVGKAAGLGKSFMEEAALDPGLDPEDREAPGGPAAEAGPALLAAKARARGSREARTRACA